MTRCSTHRAWGCCGWPLREPTTNPHHKTQNTRTNQPTTKHQNTKPCGDTGVPPKPNSFGGTITLNPHPKGLSKGCVRRRPTLPHTPVCSTIGAMRLSFRVRNETGRFPHAMTTETILNFSSHTHKHEGPTTNPQHKGFVVSDIV